jgi:hypothetical protein
MTTVVISTKSPPAEVTTEAITLQVLVEDLQEGSFDLLEVWRSRLDDQGPFEELTAAQASPAILPVWGGSKPATPVTGANLALSGKTLELKLKGVPLMVTFTGSDPLTAATAASQVTSQSLGLLDSWVDTDGQVVVSTLEVGTGVELEVVGGEAYPSLGLPPNLPSFGREIRLGVEAGSPKAYPFTDLRGSRAYFYKTRFRNRSNGSTSEFSSVFSATQVQGVGSGNVVVGYADLVTVDGKPQVGHPVQVYAEFTGLVLDGKVVTGSSVVKQTDVNGHVEFTLVRGQTLSISLPGTNLNRRIAVPTDPAVYAFNLLGPSVGLEDVFKVAVPDLIMAERRSL